MKLTHLALIGAFVLVGSAQAGEDRAVAKACKADAEHMCSGKTGQDLQQCLKSNLYKLSSTCKDEFSTLPPKSSHRPPRKLSRGAACGRRATRILWPEERGSDHASATYLGGGAACAGALPSGRQVAALRSQRLPVLS